jgi:hypothetical protein
MSKKWFLFLILLSCSLPTVHAYHTDGYEAKYMKIVNIDNKSRIYLKLYSGKEILAYEHYPVFPEDYSFGATQEGDLFSVVFKCNPLTSDFNCSLVVDRRTGEYGFYKTLLALNPDKKVGFFPEKQKNLIIIKPIFKPCIKPLIYQIVLDKDSDFSGDTDFLPNGSLKLIYAPPGHDAPITKIIHINYPKLFADCEGKK